MRFFYQKLVLVVMILWFCAEISPAQATVSMSISPMQGGTTLRLNRSDVLSKTGKEVRFRITSTDPVQYEVYQSWIQPLSASGAGSLTRDFLKFYGSSGSNGSGVLYGNFPTLISMSDQLIYTSSENGASDNFVLVYQVDPDLLNSSGQFFGRLLLTMRQIGSGQTAEAYLDVFVDAQLGFDVKAVSSEGGNAIRLSTSQPDSEDQVELSFTGNAGELRVYQQVLTPIASVADNTDMVKGTIMFSTVGNPDGIRVMTPEVLDFNRKLIYRSNTMDDEWAVRYVFNPEATFPLRAGTYRGRVRYSFENADGVKDYDFDIDVSVDPVFEMKLDFPDGKVEFSNLYPGAPAQEHTVHVTVKSNLYRPYVISQKVFGELKNDRQEILDPENFLLRVSADELHRGKTKIPELVPVEYSQEQILYISDPDGAPAEFEVKYHVVPYSDISPGNYRTEITYTLGEL